MTGDGDRNARRSGERPADCGSTDWGSMSITEILTIISSMKQGAAQGDADAVLVAIEKVEGIAHALLNGFTDDGVLMGQAARGAVDAALRLGGEMSASVADARGSAAAMTEAAGILGATHGQKPLLEAYRTRLQDHPEDAAAVRSQVRSIMRGTYGGPIVGAAAALPSPVGPIGTDSYAGVGGGSGSADGASPSGSGPSGQQSASLIDVDDTGPAGPGGGPDGGGPTGGDTPTTAVPAAGPASTTGGGGGSGPSGSGGGGNNPSALTRGGLGSPVTPGAAVPATGRGTAGGSEGATAGGAGLPEGVISLPPTAFAPPATLAGTPGAGAAGAGTPGSPGGGMRPTTGPGAGPGAAGGARSRDTRHRPPHYLNDGENGREIVGELPLVGPPVIGDWSPQALAPTVDDSGFEAVALPISDRGSASPVAGRPGDVAGGSESSEEMDSAVPPTDSPSRPER
ncbi:hypothetical protein [Gordonia polyisoprenivorans]|uniref:hypothetical protein n=1 Tax=Gordonia polyisoprenivorans TaxID=84595 RepID=UPI001AD64F47|nr:hypothetical protein [Gordonia polyisoprenivorans]QTI71200.1 hypothetical protein J6U32_12140 [Gordonia polyisoprenivorans]